ncbi:hypothetical protein LMG28614_07161 [Paraburkholderia ultramafica]|uniref:Lipoprotein n=1 Tax=Paraburkholderia ultramafica TaxID=1544867 RepID=A0A6S7BRW2_9BURK|nr:hypothetical protein [Paraburkholderia ultramafica]CAB3809907.1 hypothetical protein LMG28614_07161 [Paraburkholderia ultramafica]
MSVSNYARRYWRWGAALALSVVLAASACTIQLAPAYDPVLLGGIQGVSGDIMKLYATTGMGVDKVTFTGRQDQYNRIIGTVDALALQSQSRPVPDSAIREKVEGALAQWTKATPAPMFGGGDEALSLAASECASARHVARAPAVSMPTLTSDPNQYIPASASALRQISRAITLLRDTDCAHGLNSFEVAANRGYTQYFISEALFYESFLQR